MGYMRHNAIVVSADYSVGGLDSEHWIEVAHRRACEVFAGVTAVTDPTPSAVNGVRSFLVAPDGSKEGWDESEAGDDARARYIDWLRSVAFADGSFPLQWVEVQYGDDNYESKVTDDSDARLREHGYVE